MFRLTDEGKAYVCMQEGLIQGWKEADNIAELCSYQESFDKAPSDKTSLQWVGAPVPAAVVGDALALIKHYKSFEIMVALFYNPENSEWVARIPNQKGTGAHVSYDETEDLNVPEGYYFQGTIHSHPNMAAFWSGTDTKDQGSKAGIHLVIGTNSAGDKTSSKGSLFYAGRQYAADYAFEFPDTVPEVREDWVELIEDMRKRNTFTAAAPYKYTASIEAGSPYTRGFYGAIHATCWDDYDYAYGCGYQPELGKRASTHNAGQRVASRHWACDEDDLSSIVSDLELRYCDSAPALGLLMSFVLNYGSLTRDQRDSLVDSLDAVFARAQLEDDCVFEQTDVFNLALGIANVVCPELAPDIAEALDPTAVEDSAEDADAYYDVYDAMVDNKETADV